MLTKACSDPRCVYPRSEVVAMLLLLQLLLLLLLLPLLLLRFHMMNGYCRPYWYYVGSGIPVWNTRVDNPLQLLLLLLLLPLLPKSPTRPKLP